MPAAPGRSRPSPQRAMDDQAASELAVGRARATSSRDPRADGPGAGGHRGGARRGPRRRRPHPLDDRRHQPREVLAPAAGRGPPRPRTTSTWAGWARCRPSTIASASRSSARRRRRRRRRATLAAFRARSSGQHGPWSSATSCGRPARSSPSAGSGRWAATPAPSRSSTARRPPARSRRARGPRRRRLRAARARSGCSARGHGRAVGAAVVARTAVPVSAGYLGFAKFARRRPRSSPAPGGSRRRLPPAVVIGLRAGVRLAPMYVGLPWAMERAPAGGRCGGPARGDPRGTLVTPRGNPGTLVTFRIAGWPPAAPRTSSARAHSRSCATSRRSTRVRISVGFWNTEDGARDVRRTVELLASHTPETIPPRRTLAILGSDGQPIA